MNGARSTEATTATATAAARASRVSAPVGPRKGLDNRRRGRHVADKDRIEMANQRGADCPQNSFVNRTWTGTEQNPSRRI